MYATALHCDIPPLEEGSSWQRAVGKDRIIFGIYGSPIKHQREQCDDGTPVLGALIGRLFWCEGAGWGLAPPVFRSICNGPCDGGVRGGVGCESISMQTPGVTWVNQSKMGAPSIVPKSRSCNPVALRLLLGLPQFSSHSRLTTFARSFLAGLAKPGHVNFGFGNDKLGNPSLFLRVAIRAATRADVRPRRLNFKRERHPPTDIYRRG